MKYNQQIPVSALTAGSETTQTFRLNSTFDPDVTGVGHQPYGRDTLAALYDHYRVYKAVWKIEFPGTNDRYMVVVVPHNTATVPSTYEIAAENPLSQTASLGYDGAPAVVVRGRSYLPNLAGVKSSHYRDDDLYAALVTASPVEALYLTIIVMNTGAVTITTEYNVSLWYYVEWYDPVNVGTS